MFTGIAKKFGHNNFYIYDNRKFTGNKNLCKRNIYTLEPLKCQIEFIPTQRDKTKISAMCNTATVPVSRFTRRWDKFDFFMEKN
jgi:hypothetical protein